MGSTSATAISSKSILPHFFNPTNSLNRTYSSFPHTSSSCRRVVLRSQVCRTKRFWAPKNVINCWALRESSSEGGGVEQESSVDDGPIPATFVLRRVESVMNGLSKWIAAIIFNAYIIWRHDDAETLWFAMGCVLNGMLSVQLKQVVNQKRPSALRSDPGMPSSHAQSFYFIVMFAILSLIKRAGMNEFSITMSALTLAFGSYFSYLRVSEQFHTASQVVVGAGIGMAFSCLWFWVWNSFVANAIRSFSLLQLLLPSLSSALCFAYSFHTIRHWLQRQH